MATGLNYVDWGIDIRTRQRQPEWMDRPGLETELHHAALRGLERVNAISMIHRSFWPAIKKLAARNPNRELRILDVACGGGDIASRLIHTARRASVRLIVDGCDLSPTAVEFARERARKARAPGRYFQFDVLRHDWPSDYDAIINSLFLHHLTSEEVVHVLSQMAKASRHLVLVNDLVRSHQGYFLARFGAQLISRSPIVHSDGPISVEGAFTIAELRELASQAGLRGARVSACWLARMRLEWIRT